MLISAKHAPLAYLYLRLWDTADHLIPRLTWFNSKTMVASVPTKDPRIEIRTEIGRFEFVVQSIKEKANLIASFPSDEKDALTDLIRWEVPE